MADLSFYCNLDIVLESFDFHHNLERYFHLHAYS